MVPQQYRVLGMTVLELLVVLGVLGILLSVGVPAFEAMLARQRLVGTANELLSELYLARLEAIRRGQRVTLCRLPSAAATQCADPSSATGWEEGWMLFVDIQPQLPPQREADAPLLSLRTGIAPGLSIRGQAQGTTALFVSYTADGLSKLFNGGFLAGRIRVCSSSRALGDDERARDIVINASGRALIVCPRRVPSTCPAPRASATISPEERCR